MRGATPPLPQYVFVAWCLVTHRDNYTIPINVKVYIYNMVHVYTHTSLLWSAICFTLCVIQFLVWLLGDHKKFYSSKAICTKLLLSLANVSFINRSLCSTTAEIIIIRNRSIAIRIHKNFIILLHFISRTPRGRRGTSVSE